MQSISASVGRGGTNRKPDVFIVQRMINGFRSLQGLTPILVDGIVGDQTVNAITQFQRARLRIVDGRIDPFGPALQLLSSLLGGDGPASDSCIHCGPEQWGAGSSKNIPILRTAQLGIIPAGFPVSGPIPAPAGLTPLQKAHFHAPAAALQVAKAGAALSKIWNLWRTGLTKDIQTAQGTEEYRALSTHFKFDQHSDPLKFLTELMKTFGLIGITIARAATVFSEDMSNHEDFGNAVVGGMANPNDPRDGKIRFCPKYLLMGPLFATGVIVHEGAHWVDRKIGHVASELPAPDGWPVDSSKNYRQMTALEAQRNAYSYAQFALHISEGRDRRLNAPRDASGKLTFPD